MNKHFAWLATGLFTLALSCSEKKEEKKESSRYQVTTPLVMDTSFTKDYVAQIQSIQNIEVRAKVKGYVETINVDEGQQVHSGQLLFTIRPREYEAELQKARAELKSAELEVQNIRTLAEKNIVSQNELSLALAKLDEAKASEALAALYVSYTRITAPFEGTIDRLRFKTGSLIDEGTLLTTLSNNRYVYAYFNVSEQEYLDYKTRLKQVGGNTVSLLLANNQPHQYKGTIETIEGEFDNNTGNIAFRAKFPNPDLLLKHGETGKVQMTLPLHQVLVIPQKATYELQDKNYVYVVDAQNRIHTRNITVRQRMTNLYVIDAGLAENEKILLEGIQLVKENDRIEPVPVEPATVMAQLNKR
jgi:membrane fusion protein (multidrug efflux system)